MSWKKVLVFLAATLVFAGGLALADRMISGGGEEIARSVVDGGGGHSTNSAGLVLEGSISQSVAAVSRSSNGTMLVGGFQVMTPSPPSAEAKHWHLY